MGTAVIEDPALVAAQAEVDAAEAARVAAESAQGTVVADPAKPVEYDLKWPDGLEVDPAIVERTTADAREWGLSNEVGQNLLNERAAAIAARKEHEALVAALKPGGAEYIKQDALIRQEQSARWDTEARADPEIVGKSGDQFDRTIQLAGLSISQHLSQETRDLLTNSGAISAPFLIKDLARLARKSGEGEFIQGNSGSSAQPKSLGERLYGPDGTGKKE